MWTERDKTQLRALCARKNKNVGHVTKNTDTSNVFSYVQIVILFCGTHKSIILCKIVGKLLSLLRLFLQVKVLNVIVCTSVIPNLAEVGEKMQEIRIEIPSLP